MSSANDHAASKGNPAITSGLLASVRGWVASLVAALVLCVGPTAFAASVSLTVNLTDSTTSAPLASAPVYFYQVQSNGLLSNVSGSPFTSSGAGSVTVTLDSANTYYLKARGTNGVWTRTTNFQPANGTMNLVIGAQSTVTPTSGTQATTSGTGTTGGSTGVALTSTNATIITLKDGQTSQPLAGQSVYVYQVDPNGDIRLPNMPVTTSGTGTLSFSGTSSATYYAKARVYNSRWSQSANITGATASADFFVGTVAVLVVDATNSAAPTPLANFAVTLQDHPSTDTWRSLEILRTDSSGYLRIDPEQLSTGKEYRLQATYNNTTVASDPISLPGSYTFAVAGSVTTQLTAKQKVFHVINRLTFGMTPQLYDQIMNLTDTQLDQWRANFIAQQLNPSSITDTNLPIHLSNWSDDPATNPATASPWRRDQNSAIVPNWSNSNSYAAGNLVAISDTSNNGLGSTNDNIVYVCKLPHISDTTANYPGRTLPLSGSAAMVWGDTEWTTNSNVFTNSNYYRINDFVRFAAPNDKARLYYCRVSHQATNSLTSSPTNTTLWSATTNSPLSTVGLVAPSLNQLQLLTLRRMVNSKKQLEEKLGWFWDNHFSTYVHVTDKIQLEYWEANTYRSMAFGKFKDLVTTCFQSAQMMNMLNNNQNTKNSPNENFARELMELHTMSVDGGYTQADIVNVARALTGWSDKTTVGASDSTTSLNPTWSFTNTNHDYGPNTPLTATKNGGTWTTGISYALGDVVLYSDGQRYACKFAHTSDVTNSPPNVTFWGSRGNVTVLGTQLTNYANLSNAATGQALQVIDIVTTHPSTAKFIAKKLCNYFVSDYPSQDILDAAANTFANSNGDITQVLTTIFNHPDFYNPAYYRNKVKTPVEFAVGVARNFTDNSNYPNYDSGTFPFYNDTSSSRIGLLMCMRGMGQALYEYEFPTGWSALGNDWLGTNPMLNAYQMAADFCFNSSAAIGAVGQPSSSRGKMREWMLYTDTNTNRYTNKQPLTTTTNIINYLVALGNNGEATGYELNLYRNALVAYSSTSGAFNINDGSSTRTAGSPTFTRFVTETRLQSLLYSILTSPSYMYK